jgi:hypothetical protein
MEQVLLTAGWLIEQIDMEPTVSGACYCTVGMGGELIGSAVQLKTAPACTTVLYACKAEKHLVAAYDRNEPDAHVAAVYFLAHAAHEADRDHTPRPPR